MTDQDARVRLAAGLRRAITPAAGDDPLVPYEMLEAYVDGALDEVDREIVETRLADDEAMRAEVDDLRQLRGALLGEVHPAQPASVAFLKEGGASVPPAQATAPAADVRPEARTPLAFEAAAARRARVAPPRSFSSMAPWLAAAATLSVVVWAAAVWLGRDSTPRIAGAGDAARRGPTPPVSGLPAPATSADTGAPAGRVEPKLVVRDGGRVVSLLADRSLVGLDALDAPLRSRIAEMLESGRLPPRPGDLAAAPGQLLGPGRAPGAGSPTPVFAVVSPVGTAVRDARPAFAWTARPDATVYRVRVVSDALEIVAESDAVTTTSWRPMRPLPRGRTLQWQVEATTPAGIVLAPAPPAAEARFRVLRQGEVDAVDRVVATAGGSSLAAVWLLAEAGLRDDAIAALETLTRANPDVEALQRLQRELVAR
jgi:hypothetical protein